MPRSAAARPKLRRPARHRHGASVAKRPDSGRWSEANARSSECTLADHARTLALCSSWSGSVLPRRSPVRVEAEARMRGFLDEIDDAELSTHPPILGDWTADFGYFAGQELLRMRDFTAVFAANDEMALGLLHALHDARLRVPEDVSVVGFDDIPLARHSWPPLTTVHQDFPATGRRALALLLAEVQGESGQTQSPPEARLVVRASSGVAAHPRGLLPKRY
ncbi:MAG: substrate-binding domain-containing protein [Cryobacterium sp.]